MNNWRQEALRLLPEYQEQIAPTATASEFWGELWFEFKAVYQQKPKDEALISSIYAFAFWCWHGPNYDGNDSELITTVFSQFFENLPRELAIRRDMPRWLCLKEFEVLEAGPFAYHLNPDELLLLGKEFRQQKKAFPDTRLARCGKLNKLKL